MHLYDVWCSLRNLRELRGFIALPDKYIRSCRAVDRPNQFTRGQFVKSAGSFSPVKVYFGFSRWNMKVYCKLKPVTM